MTQRISSVSLILGESDYCIPVSVGTQALYFHGTTDQIRGFAEQLVNAADEQDRKQAIAAAQALPVPEVGV